MSDKPTCEIRWINKDGQPTPDTNPSVGLVRATFANMNAKCAADGLSYRAEPSRWYHICEHHARQMPNDWEWMTDAHGYKVEVSL